LLRIAPVGHKPEATALSGEATSKEGAVKNGMEQKKFQGALRVATLTFREANDRLPRVFNFSESVSKSF